MQTPNEFLKKLMIDEENPAITYTAGIMVALLDPDFAKQFAVVGMKESDKEYGTVYTWDDLVTEVWNPYIAELKEKIILDA